MKIHKFYQQKKENAKGLLFQVEADQESRAIATLLSATSSLAEGILLPKTRPATATSNPHISMKILKLYECGMVVLLRTDY